MLFMMSSYSVLHLNSIKSVVKLIGYQYYPYVGPNVFSCEVVILLPLNPNVLHADNGYAWLPVLPLCFS